MLRTHNFQLFTTDIAGFLNVYQLDLTSSEISRCLWHFSHLIVTHEPTEHTLNVISYFVWQNDRQIVGQPLCFMMNLAAFSASLTDNFISLKRYETFSSNSFFFAIWNKKPYYSNIIFFIVSIIPIRINSSYNSY